MTVAPPAVLARALGALLDQSAAPRSGEDDPIALVRVYKTAADQEVAAAIASGLAFGRVAAFRPVIAALLTRADQRGGPAAWVRSIDTADVQALEGLRYRWMSGQDLALWCATLGLALRRHDSLGTIICAGSQPDHPHIGPALEHLACTLRELAVVAARSLGLPAKTFADLPRGARYFLPLPSGGSACKRLCMLARWMVRPPGDPRRGDGIDLGLWDLPTAHLVIPLDTHVARMARLLSLTQRKDAGWRTAVEVTASLARLDPLDPTRFDFALAHLGISGACTVRKVDDQPPPPRTCASCPLVTCCQVGSVRPAPCPESQ